MYYIPLSMLIKKKLLYMYLNVFFMQVSKFIYFQNKINSLN